MDTNKKSSEFNYFIYAVGFICFLNILSSEIRDDENKKKLDKQQIVQTSGCENLLFYHLKT